MQITILAGNGEIQTSTPISAECILLVVSEGKVEYGSYTVPAGTLKICDITSDEIIYSKCRGLLIYSKRLSGPQFPHENLLKTDKVIECVCSDLLAAPRSENLQKSAAEYLLTHIEYTDLEQFTQEAEDSGLTTQAISYFKINLDELISMKNLEKSLNASREQITAEFKKAGLGTPLQYFSQLKLEQAKKLLEDESATISQIAHSLGYRDVSSFSHFFSKHTGKSPREFREDLHWLL